MTKNCILVRNSGIKLELKALIKLEIKVTMMIQVKSCARKKIKNKKKTEKTVIYQLTLKRNEFFKWLNNLRIKEKIRWIIKCLLTVNLLSNKTKRKILLIPKD
jgi:hypothetical protein